MTAPPLGLAMHVRKALPVLLCSLVSVSDGQGCLLSPHRSFYPDFLSKCPSSYQGIPTDELSRKSLQQLKDMAGGQADAPQGLGELPCGGVPADGAVAQKVRPGGSYPVKWTHDSPTVSECKVTLMCPRKRADTVLWTGSCGSQAGETEIKVKLPRDLQKCEIGECFLQWRMDTSQKATYCGCMDISVDNDTPVDEASAADSGAPSCTTEASSPAPTPTPTPDTDTASPPDTGSSPMEQPAAPLPPQASTMTETTTVTSTTVSITTTTETLPPQTVTETQTMPVTETQTVSVTETQVTTVTQTETMPQPLTLVSTQLVPTTITQTVTTTETLSNGNKDFDTPTASAAPTLGYGQTVPARDMALTSADIEYATSTTCPTAAAATFAPPPPMPTPAYSVDSTALVALHY